jgi:hypothetical protein
MLQLVYSFEQCCSCIWSVLALEMEDRGLVFLATAFLVPTTASRLVSSAASAALALCLLGAGGSGGATRVAACIAAHLDLP